jgi:hypothetical protein
LNFLGVLLREMVSTLHLSGWKAIFHNCSHCASLSRSLCRVRASQQEHYGIRGIINNWMKSFLSGRTQAVIVEGETSTYLPIDSGVPQGSTLGPSLFLYYINDIATGLDSTIRLFVDDIIAYLWLTLSNALEKSIMRTSACLPSSKFWITSSMNSISWASHELNLRKPCWKGYSMLYLSACDMMLLTTMCSNILQHIQVKEIGL